MCIYESVCVCACMYNIMESDVLKKCHETIYYVDVDVCLRVCMYVCV